MLTDIARRSSLAALALLLLAGANLFAQEFAEISGEVHTAQGNRLEVRSGDKQWVVLVDSEVLREAKQRTEIAYHAHGRGSILERGMWVRFVADLDATGKATAPLRELTWFTPQRSTIEGAFPVERRDGGEPIVQWDRPLRGDLIAGRYLIVGSVRAVRDGQMEVIFKEGDLVERHVFATLAPDVIVAIDITHTEVAGKMLARGDRVEVRGRRVENLIHALSIIAHREEPLGQPLVKPREPRRTADDGLLDDPLAELDRPVAAPPPLPASDTPDRDADDSSKPPRARILKVN